MKDHAQQLERHLENVCLVAKTFTAIEIHEPTAIADTLLSLAITLLGREHGVLLLGSEDRLSVEVVRGSCRETAVREAMPLWNRVATEQIAQVIPLRECAENGPLKLELCAHGIAAVALSVRERVVGLLLVGSTSTEGPFNDADLAFLTAIAAIGGLALTAGGVVLEGVKLSQDLEQTAIRERSHAEENRRIIDELDKKLQVIERQHREILMLSAPILEVGPDTLAVPLIGALDARRADEIMGRLLTEVAVRGARFVLFDMTSVEDVDPAMAHHFVKLVSAVGLMGAEGMVTGIRPRVARVMVELGVDLGQIRLLPTLRQGIEAARAHEPMARQEKLRASGK